MYKMTILEQRQSRHIFTVSFSSLFSCLAHKFTVLSHSQALKVSFWAAAGCVFVEKSHKHQDIKLHLHLKDK